MNKTVQALTDRASRPENLVAAGEVLDLRFRGGGKALSLRAGKLFHLLIQMTGAKALEDIEHAVPIADLNFPHLERDDLVECVRDLVGTTVELRIKGRNGKDVIMVDPLLFGVRRPADVYEEAGNLVFRFSPTLRKVLEQSNHWAALSRKAVLAFESRYSLRLYEIVALRVGLDHKTHETFTLEDLRRRMGVPAGKFKLWNDLRRFMLDRAVAEVNQLSGFLVTYKAIKQSRSIAAVKLSWQIQGTQGRASVARELESSRIGRRARREGTAETISAAPSPLPSAGFPAEGSIAFSRWAELIRQHAPKPTPDVDRVANAFRRWTQTKNMPLDVSGIDKSFIGFCRIFKD